MKPNKLLEKELKKSYKFFMKEVNLNESSKGYGLIRDKTTIDKKIASISSVGYGLAALIIGVEHKWLNFEKAYKRASKTLDTFINNVEGENGFYYHFINIENGKREWNCEISIIDTAIFICGAILVGEYFGREVKEKAEILYKNVNWEWYRNKESIEAIEYYNNFSKLWGKYGFKDGYNLEGDKPWFAKEYIGIDKGIEIIMIENYLNETIWKYFMGNMYVKEGLKILDFSVDRRDDYEKITIN